MRKRFKPSDRTPVKARPDQHWVQVGKSYHLFNRVGWSYTSDEDADKKIIERLSRVIIRKYNEAISTYKNNINAILGDVYVVIPHYPECSTSDIIMIIKQLHDEPTDIVAVEICKKLDL